MKKISDILRVIYEIDFSNLNILECGANRLGEETSDFVKNNNCWFVEANHQDFIFLSQTKRNSLNLALSDKNGFIDFTVSSHPGNSSCEYSEDHLNELKSYGSTFNKTTVECVSYDTLINKTNVVFDILVLDIEGHEKTVLQSMLHMNPEILPKIFVIECGYDWNERLDLLKKLGYNIDCYYFNNCFLTKGDIKTNKINTNIFNNEWRTFVWKGKTIYVNEKNN